MMKKSETKKISVIWRTVFIILPAAAVVCALCIGRMSVSPADLLAMLTKSREVSPLVSTTVLNVRLPRILLAILCGSGLSVAGCVFQSLFANPLATPDTLGIASGASFGAALALLLGAGLAGVQVSSFVFGLTAVILTFFSGTGRGRGLNGVVLAGIMIGSLFSALVSLVKFVADEESELPAITYWLMGSLRSAGYKNLIYGAPPIILCMAFLLLMRWRLDLLPLSEDEIRSTGTNVNALRGVTVICATVITASCVSMCGQVGWIGLLVPHICRMKFGSSHSRLLPASVSFGAAFMVIVDTAARSISASEIPVSVLTAIIGAPFFIYLMRKSRGWQI